MYAYMLRGDGFIVNLYASGGFTAKTPNGEEVQFGMITEYPANGKVTFSLLDGEEEEYTVAFRIPYWSKNTSVKVNGESVPAVAGSYCEIRRTWFASDTVELEFDMRCEIIKPYDGEYSDANSKYHVALRRGPLMLARDARLEANIETPVDFTKYESDGYVTCESAVAPFEHFFCFNVTDSNGNIIPMLDYASAGRTWDENSMTTVWMPTKDYWTVDMTAPVHFIAPPVWDNGAGYGIVEKDGVVSVYDLSVISELAPVTIENGADGYSRIRFESGRYLDFVKNEDRTFTAVANFEGMSFKLQKFAQDRYKLINAEGKALYNKNMRGSFALDLAPCSFATVQIFRFTK